jgi:hypothetical protein
MLHTDLLSEITGFGFARNGVRTKR